MLPINKPEILLTTHFDKEVDTTGILDTMDSAPLNLSDEQLQIKAYESSLMIANCAITYMFLELQKRGTTEQVNQFSVAANPLLHTINAAVKKLDEGDYTEDYLKKVTTFLSVLPNLLLVTADELPDGFKSKAKGFATL